MFFGSRPEQKASNTSYDRISRKGVNASKFTSDSGKKKCHHAQILPWPRFEGFEEGLFWRFGQKKIRSLWCQSGSKSTRRRVSAQIAETHAIVEFEAKIVNAG